MTALSVLCFGEGGVGKSTLFESAPGPRLLIDSEGKAGLLEGSMVQWEDFSTFPDVTEDTTVVIKCTSWQRVTEVVKIMDRYGKQFRSFGVDSFSRLQENLLSELTNGAEPDWGTWSAIKARITFLLDALAGQGEDSAAVIYATAWLQSKDERFIPLMDGAIRERIGHYFLVVGRPLIEFTDKGIEQRLHIFPGNINGESTPTSAKSNSMDLLRYYGKVVVNPDLTHMHQVLNKQIKKETTETQS